MERYERKFEGSGKGYTDREIKYGVQFSFPTTNADEVNEALNKIRYF